MVTPVLQMRDDIWYVRRKIFLKLQVISSKRPNFGEGLNEIQLVKF